MKKIISLFISSLFALGAFASCGQGRTVTITETVTVDNSVQTKFYDLKEIRYAESLYEKTYDDTFLTVNVPAKDSVGTGEEITVSTKIKANKTWKKGNADIVAGAVYFVVDWGDGTWSYNGPGVQNADMKSTVVHKHVYKKAGTYYISAAAFCMQTNEFVGWSEGKRLVVEGEDHARGDAIRDLAVISSAACDGDHSAETVTDGDGSTYFKSTPAEDPYEEQYVGYLFDDNYSLSQLEVTVPKEAEIFPSNIAVEYTSDYGKTWQSLPKYYYLYDYAKGIFNPIMRFPNPQGATLVFALDGITANGIRLVSKLTSVDLDKLALEKYLAISEMRVYGNRRTLFYTSLGNTFDADLNNMWTIYGTAKTEPNLTGDSLSSYTNGTPFRAGHTMIGSTEWLEWNGLKFNWTDYTAARETYYKFLKNTRTGSDGWSSDDGYVWATGGGQYHLDMGAHYTYNSIFIIAARNYLLQGNDVGDMDKEGNVTEFREMKNGSGQTMDYRLKKAMKYMLETLDGKNGVLVIKDPRNQGLAGAARSVASNYWDAMTAFGYISSYENILFYASLGAYADILAYYGEDNSYYLDLAETVKRKFNDTFWDRTKKRYITSINANGVKLDFGVTYVNFMAVAYGLCDGVKAEAVYSWLDGERIIEGDTSTGEDIYGRFRYAARGNTLDVSKVTDESGSWYWWYNAETMSPASGLGAYGNQMQNGGTIFYISYYDLIGRYKTDADDAFKRFSVIMEEFHKDSLRRNSRTVYGEYVEGILGEFPESGLVPYTFVSGLLGIKATLKGLEIDPALPSGMDYAGVSSYRFGNRQYSIRIDRGVTEPKVSLYDDGTYYVVLPAGKAYVISADNRLTEANA